MPLFLLDRDGVVVVNRPTNVKKPDQLALPYVFEGPPDPRPKPEKRKTINVSRKPVQREASVVHPQQSSKAC